MLKVQWARVRTRAITQHHIRNSVAIDIDEAKRAVAEALREAHRPDVLHVEPVATSRSWRRRARNAVPTTTPLPSFVFDAREQRERR